MPATLLHGDSHLGNTYSSPNGDAGLFDWQVIHRGHGVRDVAYFFLTAAGPDLWAHQREIFHLYLETMAGLGIDLDPELTWKQYSLFGLEALDAHLLTMTQTGSYGHAPESSIRFRDTLCQLLIENDVPSLLDELLAHGKI